MSVGGVFGTRVRNKLATSFDADGREIEVEVREDEDQGVKMTQSIELLLAAGYFRARIKVLSPFDKIVGGMTWCISTCYYEVDINLLFQENSTIGQKIALTEKIVAVLPKMKCPHRIEPHQIQGLDFIHIYPVVQWLVKQAIETRAEMGDYIRSFAVSQFDKYHSTPQDDEFKSRKAKAIETVAEVRTVYQPVRKYRRQTALSRADEEMRVRSTLLEYGRKYGTSGTSADSEKGEAGRSLGSGPGGRRTVKEAGDGRIREEEEEEESRISALMKGMSSMQQGALTASAVGSLVGLQSDQIQRIASEYADKRAELDGLGGTTARLHHGAERTVASLRKQVADAEASLDEVEGEGRALKSDFQAARQALAESMQEEEEMKDELEKLSALETGVNESVLLQLRSLVATNENLKKQEQEFRTQCKEERERLQTEIDKLTESKDGSRQAHDKVIQEHLDSDREKLQKICLILAKKNREISSLRRKVDETPSRAELNQYQKRFIELYNGVAARHTETKQFYTLYNTLLDTKLYLNKEVNLLNSIHDTFTQAMSSSSGRDEFLKQFEAIVESVKQNRSKVEARKGREKSKRDELNQIHLAQVEKQRLYVKTVKDLKEECRKNEILQGRLKAKG